MVGEPMTWARPNIQGPGNQEGSLSSRSVDRGTLELPKKDAKEGAQHPRKWEWRGEGPWAGGSSDEQDL